MANGRSVAPARKALAVLLGTVAAFVIFYGLGRSSWPTAALGGALLVLAISLIAITSLRGGARSWIAGSAHVVSASEPPASSAYGRCELQIVLDAVGMPAAAVKIRDPRVPVSKWPDAGATLPIMVAIDNPRHIRIQWDDVLTHAEAAEEERFAAYEGGRTGLLRPEDQFAAYEAAHPDLLGEDPDDTEPLYAPAPAPDDDATILDDPDLDDPVLGDPNLDDPDLDYPEPDDPRLDAGATDGGARGSTRGDGHPVDDHPDSDQPGSDRPDGSRTDGDLDDDQPGDGGSRGDQTEPTYPRPLFGGPVPADLDREPVIITDTPDGPIVEGRVVERPTDDDRDHGTGRPGTAGSGPRGSAASAPLPRRKPSPRRHHDPRAGHPVATPGDATATGFHDPVAAPSDTLMAGAPVNGATLADATVTVADTDIAEHEPDADVFAAYPGARPGATGSIHGVGITVLVTDLERSIAFYRDMLGFFEIDGGEGNAVLASGDTRLVLRTVPDVSPVNRRVVHLNLEVGDVETTYRELTEKGITFTYSPRPVNKGERLELWAAAFRDPDGHGIAITQWRGRPHD